MLKPKSPQASFYGSYLYDRIVPQDHLLRKINQVVDFSFVNDLIKDRYTPDFGRPAEDPEFMLRPISPQNQFFMSGTFSTVWYEIATRREQSCAKQQAYSRSLTYIVSRSSSQSFASASEGILQSPRGDRLTVPTLGPSGRHVLLN